MRSTACHLCAGLAFLVVRCQTKPFDPQQQQRVLSDDASSPSQRAASSFSAWDPPHGDAIEVADTDVYDYIVVGSGAGGIPTADRLSASGKRVLLIERGPPSSFRWGGRSRPEWLRDTNLTRFDVPGLFFYNAQQTIETWACPDVVPLASCVLGGGTAVNGGVWLAPMDQDWDAVQPEGWRSADVAGATARAFGRVPWTETPPADGVLQDNPAGDLITTGLRERGWRQVVPNLAPNDKNHTYNLSPFMFRHGERSGVMESYLVTAAERTGFTVWMNTMVARVVRDGARVTGVQVEATGPGGHSGIVRLRPGGRVILSAGVFGTAKILFRSGIGPRDQLEIVRGAEGDRMVAPSEWIDLPVGQRLDDHLMTRIVFRHPDIVNHDYLEFFDNPRPEDVAEYTANRTGVLAQLPVNPMAWDVITGSDGVDRFFQWYALIPGPHEAPNNTAALVAVLGTGKKSRGRLGIDSNLTINATTLPYLNDKAGHDLEAVTSVITSMVDILSKIPGATMVAPAPGQDVGEYVQSIPLDLDRSGIHWCGSTQMGPDSALSGSGKDVVDLDARVYGTENLHVVDASIINGVGNVNTQAPIAVVAEQATERILRLGLS